jgi:hypothetical protein
VQTACLSLAEERGIRNLLSKAELTQHPIRIMVLNDPVVNEGATEKPTISIVHSLLAELFLFNQIQVWLPVDVVVLQTLDLTTNIAWTSSTPVRGVKKCVKTAPLRTVSRASERIRNTPVGAPPLNSRKRSTNR